jgi:tRNA1Val (adenine37-N6)-methyltransferase
MSAKYILKNKAPLYIVHRPERLLELINVLNEYKFSIKKIQFIYSSFKKSAIMVLVKATKNGSDGLIVNPPINILDYKSYKGIFE